MILPLNLAFWLLSDLVSSACSFDVLEVTIVFTLFFFTNIYHSLYFHRIFCIFYSCPSLVIPSVSWLFGTVIAHYIIKKRCQNFSCLEKFSCRIRASRSAACTRILPLFPLIAAPKPSLNQLPEAVINGQCLFFCDFCRPMASRRSL